MAQPKMTLKTDAFERARYFFEHDYHDRGMVKWLGFFLSDHTEDVHNYTQQRKAIRERTDKVTITTGEVTKQLFDSYVKHSLVQVQLTTRNQAGHLKPEIRGIVQGWHENDVIIDDQSVAIDDINHIERLD